MKKWLLLITAFLLIGIFGVFFKKESYAEPCDTDDECWRYLLEREWHVYACGCDYQDSSCYCDWNYNCTFRRDCVVIGRLESCPPTGTLISRQYLWCGTCSPACAPPCIPSTNCPCNPPVQSDWTPYGSRTESCPDGCGGTANSTCYCSNACTPPNCPAPLSNTDLGFGTSGYSTSCTNDCGNWQSRTCYCGDCTLPVPTGTTLTNTGKQSTDPAYQTTSCSRGQQCLNKSASLYCIRCTPPACGPLYSNSNLGYGSLVLSCQNNQSVSCGTEDRTCYCYDCITNCPSPLSNTPVVNDPNLILTNFRACTNDCNVYRTAHCYEVPSSQPTEALTVNPNAANFYGFSSSTHSGEPVEDGKIGTLNDPINLTAEYTDTNGAGDIEGLFVWFRDYNQTGVIPSPLWVFTSGTPSSASTGSWGFMMRRVGGSWLPYVTDYSITPSQWVQAVYEPTARVFYIPGPNGQNMVRVKITQPISSAGNIVTMPFSLMFSGDDNITTNVSQIKYRMYLMGLDTFSFTPHDNYNFDVSAYWSVGQLRYRASPTPAQTYSRAWTDTLKTWTIDKEGPSISAFTVNVSGSTTLKVDWSTSDVKNLYTIIGNIYSTGGAETKPIVLSSPTEGVEFKALLIPEVENPYNTGLINGVWSFRVAPNMTTSTHIGTISVDVGENRIGALIFYLTVFDDAGNMVMTSNTFDLNDWLVTDGGLSYSQQGTYFITKSIEEGVVWNDNSKKLILPPFNTSGWAETLIPSKADLSSEMWAEDSSPPLKSNNIKSYSILGHGGYKEFSYYDVLKKSYEEKKISIEKLREIVYVPADEDITWRAFGLASRCGNYIVANYCAIFINEGNLIADRLTCNHRAVIFVDGNLTILPSIDNTNMHKDACIFIVRGNVIIEEGQNASSYTFGYDSINAYVLAEGSITVNHETSKNPGSRIDGLYINGGLHAYNGITVKRYLRLVERLSFPVIAVDHHPKYGVVGGVFFGNNFLMQKGEIGFKPY